MDKHINNKHRELKKEVYERTNLIYCEDIPLKVLIRIDEELDFILNNNLSELFLMLDKVGRFVRERGYYFDGIGDSLIAYLLGISRINPMDIADDYGKFTKRKKLIFDINIPSSIFDKTINYINSLSNRKQIYRRMGYKKRDLEQINKLQKDFKSGVNIELTDILKDRFPVVQSYYFISSNVDVSKYSIVGEYKKEDSLDFDFRYLDTFFPIVDFRSSLIVDRLQKLQEVNKYPIDEIEHDNMEIVECSFLKVPSNDLTDYKSPIHYNMWNNFDVTLKLTIKGEVSSIFDLLKLKDCSLWRCKVLCYYYDTWYRTYGDDTYYNVYLTQLLKYFNIKKEDLKNKDDAVVELILNTIQAMKIYGIHFIYEKEGWF